MAHLGRFYTAVGFVLLATSFSPAATLTVDLNGGADYTDIQAAIDAAKDGDTVLVKPGEYVIAEPINFNRLHKPDDPASPPVKNIVVKSEGGAEVTTIRMAEILTDPDRPCVVIFKNGETNATMIEGLKLTGGKGNSAPLEENYCGGGLFCYNSSPTITKGPLKNN